MANFGDIPSNITLAALQGVRRNAADNGFEAVTLTIDGLLPSQSGNSGKFLTTNGSAASWATISTGITIGSTVISSGTNGRILYQSGGVVQQSGGLTFNGTDLDMALGGNVVLNAGNLYQRQNGRSRYYNNANSNWADIWNPSSTGSAPLNIFDGTGTGIHLDGSGNVGIGTTSPSVKFHVNGSAQIDGTLTLSAQNIATDTTTGMKIGTSSSQKLGFFNATPVTQRSNIGALTDNTGGASGSSIDTVIGGSDTVDASVCDDNFRRLLDRMNAVEQLLQDLGLTA